MAKKGEENSQQSTRGASALTDNIRWQASMNTLATVKENAPEPKNKDENLKNYVRFGANKENYGQPSIDKWFKRGTGGVLLPATDLILPTNNQTNQTNQKTTNGNKNSKSSTPQRKLG